MANREKDYYDGSSQQVYGNNDAQDALIEKMNANSQAWHNADEAEKTRLHDENMDIATQLGGSVNYDEKNGTWMGVAKQDTFKVPEYVSRYNDDIAARTQQYLNRPAFSYNYQTDPLYQQYAEAYTRNGQRAMQDTVGNIAARTGGLASSYAGTAGQGAYNTYMQQLNDKIPELQQLAYQMYRDEGNKQLSDINLLQQLENTNRSDFVTDRNFGFNAFADNRDTRSAQNRFAVGDGQWKQQWDYSLGRDALADQRYADETAYSRGRDTIADKRYADEQAYQRKQDTRNDARSEVETMVRDLGVDPKNVPANLLEAAGYSDEYLAGLHQYFLDSRNKRSGGGGGGGGGNPKEEVTPLATQAVTPLQNTNDIAPYDADNMSEYLMRVGINLGNAAAPYMPAMTPPLSFLQKYGTK